MDAKAKKERDRKKRKEEADLELFVRLHDSFSRTIEGIRSSLDEIDNRREALDAEVYHGLGVVESKGITQGLEQGATQTGIYGIKDLLFNPNSKEYMGITKEETLLRFDWSGNTLPPPKPPTKPFTRFTYCAPTGHYICWTPNKSSFFFAREDFTVAIDSVAIAPISTIVYGGRKTEESFDFFVIAGATLNRYSYNPVTNLIALQDAMTLSDIEADGHGIELTCFDEPTDDRKQWIYCTFGPNCTIIDITGRVHGTKRNLHPRRITAISAIGPSDFVVTGDEKGLLKLWGFRWAFLAEIQAHKAMITHVIEHPDGRGSISFGKDQRLVVYGFDSMKEIESLPLPEEPERVIVNRERKGFMTQGARQIVMWKMNTLYELCQSVMAPVVGISLSAESGLARRAVTVCLDNAIHIMNPATGHIITTALVNPIEPPIRSVTYHHSPTGDTLYTIGESEGMLMLQQFDCRTNPANLKETWEETKWSVGITCLAIYEFNPKIAIVEKQMTFSRGKKVKQMPPLFLICGRRDGCLAILDIKTGEMDCVTAGHKSPVSTIEVDHEVNQAVSLGWTPSIRLWKIGTYHDEALIPLLDINWKQPILLATIVRNVIAFVLDHKDTEQHKVVMFNTSVAKQFDHGPDEGHKMKILSISACRELMIFCTSSLDGTIAIRGSKNEFYSSIILNNVPTFAGFVTAQGDIFLGIDTGIYSLPAQKHLTVVPRNRAVRSELPVTQVEEPLPHSKLIWNARMRRDVEVQTLAPFPTVGSFTDERDSKLSRAMEDLRHRDEDIWNIVEGRHVFGENIPDPKNMSKKDWDDFGKSVFEDDPDERKFFASESRLAAMIKLKGASQDLDNFDNVM